jgi:hypothetical protein
VRVEEAREHLGSEAPVETRELDEGRPHGVGNVVPRRVAAEVDDLLDLERVADRELGRGEAAARRREDRRAPADGVDYRLELTALRRDRRPRGELARAEAAADPVEADDAVARSELEVERPLVVVLPLLLEVRHPAWSDDDRRPVAERRVGEPPPLEVQVPDLLLHRNQSIMARPGHSEKMARPADAPGHGPERE